MSGAAVEDGAAGSAALVPAPSVPSSADSGENLRIMIEGRVFDRFVVQPAAPADGAVAGASAPAAVVKEAIFLYYEPNTKLGSFYWCEPGKRERWDDWCIPMSSISDIFLGRQTPELKAPIAAGGSADNCFSITAKRASLHLRCESASVRTAFLAGIKHVWQAQAPTTGQQTPTMIMTPNIAAMQAGCNFVSLSRSGLFPAAGEAKEAVTVAGGIDRRELFVWYESGEGKLGSLYWCDAGGARVKVPGQTLQLHRISDVFLGKQVPEMKGPEAASFPSSCCFSIVAKDKAVHLVAPSESVRTTWLAAIKDVFANVGKKATDSKDRKSGPASLDRSTSRPASAGAGAAAAASTTPPAPAATPSPGPGAGPAVVPVAASVASAERPRTTSPAAAAAPIKPQLTVTPPPEASSISYLSPGTDTLPAASSVPRADRPSALEASDSALTSPTTAAAVATLHHESAVAVKSKTSLLEQGHVFTAFVGVSPTVRRRLFVWYDDKDDKLGTLYWNERDDGVKAKSSDMSIPFHRISDVYLGKQSLELKSQEAAGAPENVCFSVVSRDKTLHLAADSPAVRVDFLSNIRQIFQMSGQRVDEEKRRLEQRREPVAEAAAPLPELRSAYLEVGQRFVSYEDDNVVLDILLWYVNQGAELGFLYWSDTGRREERDDRRMAVPFISDIYMGKQTPQLEAYTAADAPDNCCFSLVSADRSLHLKSFTPAQRTDFLSALRDLFVLAGKRTQQEAQELVIQQALLADPRRALLLKGSSFIGFFGREPTVRREVLVWLAAEDGRSGTLYWSADGTRDKSSERSISLGRVTDVFMGKQTPELNSEAARELKSNRCFSVLTRDRGLHLAAADEQQRGDWLSAIKSVFIEAGKRVDGDHDRLRSRKDKEAAERLAAQQSTVGPNQDAINKEAALLDVYTPQTGAVAPSDALLEGRDYLAIVPSSLPDAPLSYWSRPIHLFYSADGDSIGRLYWCDRGRRERLEEQSLALSRVSEVFIGKQTDELKSAEGQRYDSKQTVAVVCKTQPDRNLHLVARDESARDEFVTSLRAAFARAAKPPFNVQDPAAITAMMVAGAEVTSYIGSGIIGSSTPALVWFAPRDGKLGTIYWNEDAKKEKVPGLQLAVNHITDVFLGKKTPELLSIEGLFANSEHCLSVMSRKNSLHVEFRTGQVRDAWLQGIKTAYASTGRIVSETKAGAQPGTRVVTIISSRKPDAVKVSPILLEGRPFVRYQTVNGQLKKKRVHLWLVKQDGPLGTLYWEDMAPAGSKQPMDKRPEHSIAVSDIRDVYIGKQTPLFHHPDLAAVPADCCISISSKDLTLDLATKYSKDRRDWLTAIHTVFISSGKKVVSEEPLVTAAVMDQPVWTPFGEGLAERWPRHDGITAVRLNWAVAYVNLESLHRLVHVKTPLGPAILLPGDPTRGDGTVPVQLPWGVSYVNKKDIVPLKSTSAPSSRQISPQQSGPGTPVAVQAGGSLPVVKSIRPVAVGDGMPGGRREAKHEYSKEEAVSVLSRGVPFTLIAGPDPVVPTATLIVAWLAANDGVLGTLYYNPAGQGSDRADHAIPVHTITDLYLGSLAFASTTHHPDRAMSVVGRDETWHLLAESPDQRTAWYYALHSLISSSGKDVVSEDRPSPSADGVTSHHFHYTKPVEPDYAEATAVLRSGGDFTQHTLDPRTGERRTQPVYVNYDASVGELGALCSRVRPAEVKEAEEEKERRDGGETVWWKLEDIRDLFLGNRNFRKAGAGAGLSVSNDLCLSLVLRDKAELNLEAATKQQRDAFFYSLVSILKHQPDDEEDTEQTAAAQQQQPAAQADNAAVLAPAVLQPVLDSQLHLNGSPKGSPRSSPAPGQMTPPPGGATPTPGGTTPTPPLAGSTPSSPTSNIVASGLVMTVWSGDETAAASSRQFVYWDPPEGKRRLGTLRWCDVGRRERVEGQELPLHYISDVFVGRQSAALKSPEATAAASGGGCFVLFSKQLTFSAQCDSDKQREAWLKAFKRMFTQAGKSVVQQKSRTPAATPTAGGGTPSPEPAGGRSSHSPVVS